MCVREKESMCVCACMCVYANMCKHVCVCVCGCWHARVRVCVCALPLVQFVRVAEGRKQPRTHPARTVPRSYCTPIQASVPLPADKNIGGKGECTT